MRVISGGSLTAVVDTQATLVRIMEHIDLGKAYELHTLILMWRASTGDPISAVRGHFLTNDKHLAGAAVQVWAESARPGHLVVGLYDVNNGPDFLRVVHELAGKPTNVLWMVISPDGRRFMTVQP